MKRLHTHQEAAQWLHSRVRGVLRTDSRRVQVGDGFVAWPGGVTDGRAYVAKALQQGASACLVEAKGVDPFDWSTSEDPAIAVYDGLKAASGLIAAAYYEQPSQSLDLVAITGTNGKTSTAWWLAHALGQLGQRCAMVGTLGVGEVDALEVTGMTTPDPVLLQARLLDMVNAGVKACAIEASSIGLAEHRLDGTQVRVAMFTNFTQDHLDYHGDMASYWQAKSSLFGWTGLQAAVVNVDDAQGALLAKQLQEAGALSVWTVSCDASMASNFEALHAQHVQACNIKHGHLGLSFDVVEGSDPSGHV
jgi:UDP-N-acetylmuramoyl-L-alanyl-D-glutamate--2,6-diaminopimelate ligase